MKYRLLGKTGMKVSEIGYGGEYLEGKDYETVKACIDRALEAGVNVIDIFMSEPQVRSNIGKALGGRREQVLIQGHFRSVWKDGQYGRTFDMEEIRFFFKDLLTRLQTDYIDIGMIHMIDTFEDYEKAFEGELYSYVRELKEKGVVRAVGLSSHNPEVALRAVKEGRIDVLMFSLNLAYDFLDDGGEDGPLALQSDHFSEERAYRYNEVREELYRACEEQGVGITVMKGLGAGVLLDEARSPFGVALTVPQCIHYALSRPAVASVMAGLQSTSEVEAALACETLPESELDYSHVLAGRPRFSLAGHCMYCNHCHPCPAHIDIARVNQYLDIAEAAGEAAPTVREHYGSLEHGAADCIFCGGCEERCPFGVSVRERMKKAAALFGR